MRSKNIKKWSFRVATLFLFLTTLIIAASVIFINQLIDSIYGGKISLVNHSQFQTDINPTVITNVSILSPDGMKMLPDRTVLLKDGLIHFITEDPTNLGGMSVINGQGKFLIPGLIDSHIHLQFSPNDLLLYVANGVTEVREMSGSKAHLRLRQEIKNGRIGPRIFVASPQLVTAERFQGWFQDSTRFTHSTQSVKRAEAAARSFAEINYDGLKLYAFLEPESYRAVLNFAEELGIPTIGHLPEGMPLSELRTIKLQQIGHIEEIVKALLVEFGDYNDKGSEAFIRYVESRKNEIVSDLITNNISVHSTLWFSESIKKQVFGLESLLSELPLEYANPGIVEGSEISGTGWIPGSNRFENYASNDPKERVLDTQFWSARIEAHYILLKAMVEKGVNVLAATDAGTTLTIPGFSLHDELKALNRSGMTPAQSLYAATAAPAKLTNNNAGLIEKGRRADLILLDKNPLVDIENTASIRMVILNGRVLDRTQLDTMLLAVKSTNAKSRNFDLSVLQ